MPAIDFMTDWGTNSTPWSISLRSFSQVPRRPQSVGSNPTLSNNLFDLDEINSPTAQIEMIAMPALPCFSLHNSYTGSAKSVLESDENRIGNSSFSLPSTKFLHGQLSLTSKEVRQWLGALRCPFRVAL